MEALKPQCIFKRKYNSYTKLCVIFFSIMGTQQQVFFVCFFSHFCSTWLHVLGPNQCINMSGFSCGRGRNAECPWSNVSFQERVITVSFFLLYPFIISSCLRLYTCTQTYQKKKKSPELVPGSPRATGDKLQSLPFCCYPSMFLPVFVLL